MGSTGKKSSGGSSVTTSTPTTSKVSLTNSQHDSIMNTFRILRDMYGDYVTDKQYAPQNAKDTWQNLSDAADRLYKFDGVPALSSGYAAEILWDALPGGTTVNITNSGITGNDGVWIKGTGTSQGPNGYGVWTHLTLPDGTKPLSGVHRSSNDTPADIDSKDKMRMRIIKFGK